MPEEPPAFEIERNLITLAIGVCVPPFAFQNCKFKWNADASLELAVDIGQSEDGRMGGPVNPLTNPGPFLRSAYPVLSQNTSMLPEF